MNVLPPRPSRSGFENDETGLDLEIEPIAQPSSFEWKWAPDSLHKNDIIDVDLLLVAMSLSGRCLLASYFGNRAILATCEARSDKLNAKAILSKISLPEQNIATFVLECGNLALQDSWLWCEQLSAHVSAKRVIVFDEIKRGEGITTFSADDFPLLRRLGTSFENKVLIKFTRNAGLTNQEAEDICPELETPNIIQGISAAILGHCEINEIPCSVFLTLLESGKATSLAVKQFEPILSQIGISAPESSSQTYSEFLKNQGKSRDHSLYL